MRPPAAPSRPAVQELFGDTRSDDFAWLRNRDDPAVIEHLEAENAYCDAALAHLDDAREELFTELRSHVVEDDTTAPVPDGEHEYYWRTITGREYRLFCRRPRGGGAEQILLDINELAAGGDYCNVGDAEVSPDQRLLAYTVDRSGAERYTLRVRELETGRDLDDAVADVYYTLAWSGARTVVYTRTDQQVRPWQVLAHTIGEPSSADRVLHQEDDARFFCDVERSRSGRFVVVSAHSKTSSEVRLLHCATGELSLVAARREQIEYQVEDWGDDLLIVTNDSARNFRLMRAPVGGTAADWTEVVPHREEVKLDSVDAFAGWCALYVRSGGLKRIEILRRGSVGLTRIDVPEEVSCLRRAANREWEARTLRCEYTSLLTPLTTLEIDIDSGARRVVKETMAPGWDPAVYVSERLWATASDGVEIPVSVVRPHATRLDGTAPLLLYGYGSYGISMEPAFRERTVPLLQRGVVYAIAHIRGGGEMGRAWYEAGKLERKTTTFDDFIACADRLAAAGYSSPQRTVIRGGSAGGLLIGAVLNRRPTVAAAAVAEVPFVDALNTMLDAELPLTVTEYEEWGDPNTEAGYRSLRAYSPYDNVTAAPYPAVLAIAGLNDPRVGYWEAAKWVQRLRRESTSGRPVLLHLEMGAGHAGPAGRYQLWREEAMILAFILDQLGVLSPAAPVSSPPSA